jgi:hypothetical protein
VKQPWLEGRRVKDPVENQNAKIRQTRDFQPRVDRLRARGSDRRGRLSFNKRNSVLAALLKFLRGYDEPQKRKHGQRAPPIPEPNYTPLLLDPCNHPD